MRATAGLLALALGLLPRPAGAERVGAYGFPFVDPYVSTVVGTPVPFRLDLPPLVERGILERRWIELFPERAVPDVFAYDSFGLEYGLARQEGRAPLVIVIAGTGATERSVGTVTIASVLYAGGYHVLTLPSPTVPNFILNGSSTGVPGNMTVDAADLYRVMQVALADCADELDWSEVHLTGFSLGAMNAAYVAMLDTRERQIGFGRVLLLNPPVNLYSSMRILDGLFARQVGDEPGAATAYVDAVIGNLARLFATRADELDLSGEAVYRIYRAIEPTTEDLAAVVGIAFRLMASNLAFTSDVFTNAGYVVPKGADLDLATPLTPYLKVLLTLSFADYIRGIYLPFYRRLLPTLTFEEAVRQASLRAVDTYLREAEHVGLITNEDDIILGPGELAYLEELFGRRAVMFPTGGHGGNLAERAFAIRINAYFRQ